MGLRPCYDIEAEEASSFNHFAFLSVVLCASSYMFVKWRRELVERRTYDRLQQQMEPQIFRCRIHGVLQQSCSVEIPECGCRFKKTTRIHDVDSIRLYLLYPQDVGCDGNGQGGLTGNACYSAANKCLGLSSHEVTGCFLASMIFPILDDVLLRVRKL